MKVLSLDCRAVEPTERGLRGALGCSDDVQPTGGRALALPAPTVVVLDHFEVFQLMDTWLRNELVPRLPAQVTLILAGRSRPVAGWFSIEGFRCLPLGPLEESQSLALLEQWDVHSGDARRLARIARGHPLALTLAAVGVVSNRKRVGGRCVGTRRR